MTIERADVPSREGVRTMRIKDAAKTFGGACVMYVVIAACNVGENSARYFDADGSAPNGHDGSPAGGDGAGSDLVDALTNPVPDAKADPSTSGTRLKARYYAGADGSRQFAGWHDSQRNEDCAFSLGGDGVMRCIPNGAAALTTYFTDGACSTPVTYVPKGCAAPTNALSYGVIGACVGGTPVHVLSVLGPLSASGYVKSGNTCTLASSGLETVYDLYATGAEVPASSFVQAAVQIDP